MPELIVRRRVTPREFCDLCSNGGVVEVYRPGIIAIVVVIGCANDCNVAVDAD